MRDNNQHILFVATEYEAGMRSYASAIIHALWQKGDQVLIVIKREDYKRDFDDIPATCMTWISYPTSKIGKAKFRFRPSSVIHAIENLVEENDIRLIYSLTEELVLSSGIRRLQRRCPVLYTVHDAIHHDIKFKTIEAWARDRILMARPQRLMLKRTRQIVTNSLEQQRHIKQFYPTHDVHYAPFPTLVNDAISSGGSIVPELQGIDSKYILFFGNLLLYKGVHLLYDAYMNHPELQQLPLVIAGSGTLYFDLCPDARNVILINRFIDDDELKDLFSRAATVVYPYISATQSGVISIASYFGCHMVLSDLPFFVDTCRGYKGIEFFTSCDLDSMAQAVLRSIQSTESTKEIYDEIYNPKALQNALNDIISTVLD